MGLSNEERIHKAIWAANRITKIGNKLNPESDDFDNFKTRYVVEHLKKLCLEVIPTMSSSKGNSMFWIVGADMEVGVSKTTLWSLALHDKIKNAMTPEARKEIKERNEKKEDMWGKELRKDDQNLFEPDGYLSEQQKHVYDIYLWCQQFMYASNRYKDELSTSYSEVNGKLSLILNECFNIFNMEKGYAIAYLKSKVFPFLLGCKKYDKYWDELTRYIIKNHRQYVFKNYGDKWDEFLLDTLKCWWIDIRQGASEFSSLSFYADIPTESGGHFGKPKQSRFWAKLSDCNNIEFEFDTKTHGSGNIKIAVEWIGDVKEGGYVTSTSKDSLPPVIIENFVYRVNSSVNREEVFKAKLEYDILIMNDGNSINLPWNRNYGYAKNVKYTLLSLTGEELGSWKTLASLRKNAKEILAKG